MAKSLLYLCQMQRNQLTRINKEDLIEAILSAPERSSDDSLKAVTEQLNTLVQGISDLKKAITSQDSAVNKKVNDLQMQVNTQAEIIKNQQRFLEMLDRKDRECNVVILGVPDEHESLEKATSDDAKLSKIWDALALPKEVTSFRRLGNGNTSRGHDRKRPILVTLPTRNGRDTLLEKAKMLKTSGQHYSHIYIKKDIHPNVRAEWKRLRDAEKT